MPTRRGPANGATVFSVLSKGSDKQIDWKRLASNAEDFRQGADLLLDHSGAREQPNIAIPASILVLTGFAWELFFKANLAKRGETPKQLKSYGHDLIKLREYVVSKGWSFEVAVREARDQLGPHILQPASEEVFDIADEHFLEVCELTSSRSRYEARYPTMTDSIP